MKLIFDTVSKECSKVVTNAYSTSFSLATKMLSDTIRQDIYNIYGFVRFADEIVDSFHDYDKEKLFTMFEKDLEAALENKISLNPILNSFQETYHKYGIDKHFVDAFMNSMRLDLHKKDYLTDEEYKAYIYGSADVVGLMCLKVFVKGNQTQFDELKDSAMSLGSAFQKVNFLRDLKADFEDLSRTYFPNTDLTQLDEASKKAIITEIEEDFAKGLEGIKRLPLEARFGVFMAYRYYSKLLDKLKQTPALQIKSTRIRVPNYKKIELLTRSYVKYQLNLL
ncbi:phytoene/squalene synthase family protein [Winogradskyella undariae]|uniref:phytoene/squalene synthase family protein n=1 Tax=Winogradskyella TaxID=286104 RepID=UPI00156B080A|nr:MULTISPECIES: phytoene/squalene synthase family protein [Winogradskyella]NRR90828.1 phytoene/squalene synthase family protein [Winogradskyella undariae]QXP79402.1 phytoene/squalene synthase family protein [Winogradskyella sp. HaHa_3_26]